MMIWKNSSALMLVVASVVAIGGAGQAVVPEPVPVSNPGNKADTTRYGPVAYGYRIGKYEVTNDVYCELLNGMAKLDPLGLYDSRMAVQYGGIQRSSSLGSYAYAIKEM